MAKREVGDLVPPRICGGMPEGGAERNCKLIYSADPTLASSIDSMVVYSLLSAAILLSTTLAKPSI